MAHNMNVFNGKTSYIGRQAAWHSLGTVTGKYQTWSDIQAHGGFNFLPVKNQLSFDGKPVAAWGIFRSDNGAFLGPVGEAYTPIPHQEGFRGVDALVASIDGAHYETAGVLGAGETVWGLADLNLSITVGRDDKSETYLLFSTSHNATMSFGFWLTYKRVQCANMLRAATAAAPKFRIKHTKNAQERITSAHAALATIQGESRTMEEKLNFLATRKMTRESMGSILNRLFPAVKDDDGKDRDTTRRSNILAEVLNRYEYADGNAFPEQRGTSYNLLNAITEYSDHFRGSRNDQRAESAMFGSGERLKSQALEVITLESAGLTAMPARPVYTYTPQVVDSSSSLLDQVLVGMGA